MNVLVVQDIRDLGEIWCRFLLRQGIFADLATSEEEAVEFLSNRAYDALVVEPALADGGGIGITDFATYKNPDISILAVTKSSFFSDGSIFSMIPNARGFLRTPVRPGDISAYLEHFRESGERRKRQHS